MFSSESEDEDKEEDDEEEVTKENAGISVSVRVPPNLHQIFHYRSFLFLISISSFKWSSVRARTCGQCWTRRRISTKIERGVTSER